MKKIISLCFVMLMLVGIQNANAQNSTTSPIRRAEQAREQMQNKVQERLGLAEENRDEFKAKLQEMKQNREQIREERKIKLQAKRAEVVSGLVDRVFGLFDKATARLEQASSRISEKVEMFKGKGVDVTASIDLLEIADNNLESAKTELYNIKNEIDKLIAGEEVGQQVIRTMVNDARDVIKSVRKSYTDVLVSLKASIALRVEENGESNDENEE